MPQLVHIRKHAGKSGPSYLYNPQSSLDSHQSREITSRSREPTKTKTLILVHHPPLPSQTPNSLLNMVEEDNHYLITMPIVLSKKSTVLWHRTLAEKRPIPCGLSFIIGSSPTLCLSSCIGTKSQGEDRSGNTACISSRQCKEMLQLCVYRAWVPSFKGTIENHTLR
jgi:hypothetical protein